MPEAIERYLGAKGYANFQRVSRWRQAPESCACGQRASHLCDGRPLCSRCADPNASRMTAALVRTKALMAEVTRERQAAGVVGFALPFEEVTAARGEAETWHRGCFGLSTVVPLTRGHGGAQLGIARAFCLPSGLFFEADLEGARHHLNGLKGCSIAANVARGDENPVVRQPDGTLLRHIYRGELTEIALMFEQQPHYRATWCWTRTADAWQRVYGGLRTDYQRIAAGD